jgi:signal transduction histidine kinase
MTERTMTAAPDATHALPAPPWARLRERLLAFADERAAAGDASQAAALRGLVADWWQEQSAWDAEVATRLAAHHEINNALVGVSGHVQILLMSPLGQQASVRERLEVVLRESQRIRDAALELRQIRAALNADAALPAPRRRGEAAA